MTHPVEADDLWLTLSGLQDAWNRHLTAYRQKDLRVTSTSAAEASYWIWVIDEHLQSAECVGPGYRERRATGDGEYVIGMRFVRDRQAHQLVTATGPDDRLFFGGGRPGEPIGFPPIHLAEFAIWGDVEDLRPGDPSRAARDDYKLRRDTYQRLFAGQSTYRPIQRAHTWIHGEVTRAIREAVGSADA